MNHKDRKDAYRRSGDRMKSLRRFILFVEGRNTEKSYFDLLKRANCKVMPDTRGGNGIPSCIDFVNQSYKTWNYMPKEERDKYDKRWLVFDADGRADFDAAIKLARKKGFGVAYSNMCFEYWFLLHFYDHNGSPIPMFGKSHSAAHINMINKFVKNYNKQYNKHIAEYASDGKNVKDDFFDLMLAVDSVTQKRRIVTAFERAQKIHSTKKETVVETTESVTTIYELLFELGVIKETKDGYELYIK